MHSLAFIHYVFSVPPTQTSIEYKNFVEYHPMSSIIDSGPIEFDVSSRGQNYFANIQLLVKAKITRDIGTTFPILITWKKSICFNIVFSSKSTFR